MLYRTNKNKTLLQTNKNNVQKLLNHIISDRTVLPLPLSANKAPQLVADVTPRPQ